MKNLSKPETYDLASVIGERIRRIRKEEGLSLELFARRCDMSAAYLSHIERGVQNPTLNTLERICKGLGINIEELFKSKDSVADIDSAMTQHLTQITIDLPRSSFTSC